MKKTKVLITGGHGYIGLNLVQYLEDKNFEIIVLDPHIDILDYMPRVDFECIIHLAAFPGVANCKLDFQKAVLDNISSAFTIFQYANERHIPVIFTSSQAAKNPFDNEYAFIKGIIEVEANRLIAKGADIRILRLCNVYGGKDYLVKKNTVVKKFIEAKKLNEFIVINGDGKQIRDFIHVNDVCEAIYLSIVSESFDMPIDIGSGKGVSILELAKMFNCQFTFRPKSDIIGIMKSVADIKPAEKTIGFISKHNLFEYIENEIRNV